MSSVRSSSAAISSSAWKSRRRTASPTLVIPSPRATSAAKLSNLARRVAGMEAAIAAHRARHPDLGETERLLRSIPGVGPVTAITLIAWLAELGQTDRRAIASRPPATQLPARRNASPTPVRPAASPSEQFNRTPYEL